MRLRSLVMPMSFVIPMLLVGVACVSIRRQVDSNRAATQQRHDYDQKLRAWSHGQSEHPDPSEPRGLIHWVAEVKGLRALNNVTVDGLSETVRLLEEAVATANRQEKELKEIREAAQVTVEKYNELALRNAQLTKAVIAYDRLLSISADGLENDLTKLKSQRTQ